MNKIESKSRYQHAKDAILRYIGENAPDGEQLPSETQFAAMLGVSRNTIREAIKILEREGRVYSRHGVGTFSVSLPRQLSTNISVMESATKIIEEHGYAPGTVNARVRVVPAGDRVAAALALAPEEKTLYIERVRTADRVPVVFVQDYLVYQDGLETAYARFREDSIFRFLREHADVKIGHSLCGIKAVLSTKPIEKALGLDKTVALLHLEQTHFSSKGQPILYSDSFFVSDKFNFTVVRKAL